VKMGKLSAKMCGPFFTETMKNNRNDRNTAPNFYKQYIFLLRHQPDGGRRQKSNAIN